MKVTRHWRLVLGLNVLLLAACGAAWAQTCYTAGDMEKATQTALTNTGQGYFDMVAHGDSASLRQNAIPSLAANFSGIEEAVKDNQAALSGAQGAARPPFLLKAEGATAQAHAEFLCGVFGAHGQTADSAVFMIPNLPPGSYAVVIMDARTAGSPYTVTFVLEQQGGDWKLGGLYIKPVQAAGHDGNWFAEQARAYKTKGQFHNAWFYYQEARDLLAPVSFMSTMVTDQLYDEAQNLRPADVPWGGSTTDLAAGAKTFKLTEMFPTVVGKELELVVKYQSADVSNTAAAFQDNTTVMKTLLAKVPELREAFAGIVARAVEPSGRDYGTMLEMKSIK